MSYKIKLKFISRNKQPVPNLYYEAGIGYKTFSHGYSHQETGESIIFEVQGTVTTIQVSKEPNNTVQLVTLQQIEHTKLNKTSINEITIIVPVQMISFLLEEQKKGTYERNIETTPSPKDTKPKALKPKTVYPAMIFHTVQSGESLDDIAKRYGVSVSYLKRLNSLNSNNILINQKIYIKEGWDAVERKRQAANLVTLVYILGASRRTNNAVTTVQRKEGTKQIYITFGGQAAAILGLGITGQVGIATDNKGNIGIFITSGGQVITGGTPGLYIDGGVTVTNAKDITELAGWGYSVGAQVHALAGFSAEIGTATATDVNTGEDKTIIAKSKGFGFGGGGNSHSGASYTVVYPLLYTEPAKH